VAHQTRHEDDVVLALAEDLVGDVHAAALGIARLRRCDPVSRGVPGWLVVQRGVLAQDAGFQFAQLRARLDAELPDQDVAQLAVGAERVGLPPAAVQGEQALEPEPLTQRMR